MKTIDGITDQPNQVMSVTLADGSRMKLSMFYVVQQRGWFADLTWQDFTLNGFRLVSSPNLLRQWQEIIPFGLAITTTEQGDPQNVTDFADGRSTLVLLDEADVAEVEAVVFPGF